MHKILEQFSNLHPGFGEVALCRLGQHSFLVKLGETLLALDPYLSANPKRLIPTLIEADEMVGIDLFLGSHDHADHIDRRSLPALASASPKASFIVPDAVRESVDSFPADRLIGANDMKRMEFGDISITGVAAAHEFLDMDDQGRYPYLGFVLHGYGVTLYHSGDCCVYEGLATKLASFDCDIMLLPINGRDAYRYTHDCIGNMTYQEAADLAGWLKCPLTIPAHYDMFTGNTEKPELFVDYMNAKYPSLGTAILEPGDVKLFKVR